MKELSIEEKAKAYDEALKVLHKYDVANIMFPQSLKEEMFPELAESEDEKVREWLIRTLKALNTAGVDIEGAYEMMLPSIAWLEKQGEHAKFCDSIQVGDKVTRNQDGVLVNLSQLNRVAKKDEKQGEKKPAFEMKTTEESLGINSDTYNEIVDECIYGEQKPTDLRTWKYIVDAVLTEENGIGNYLDRPNTEKIAKKLQERFGNVEQKPVDNKMPCNPDKCIYVQKYREKQKPVFGYTWKPSEEQMKALKEACDEHWEPDGLDPLYTLYQDLKKLKE